MRAAVYHGAADIRVESIAEPADPSAGEVVLEVLRAAICDTDSSEWSHGPLLARPPVVLGHEFVGRVVRTLGLHSTAAWPSSWRRRPRSAGSSPTPSPTTRRRWRSRWRLRCARCRSELKNDQACVVIGVGGIASFVSTPREIDLVTTVAHICDQDLPDALELLESTDLARTVLDRVIPLDDLVDTGIRPLAEGTAGGKIVVDRS